VRLPDADRESLVDELIGHGVPVGDPSGNQRKDRCQREPQADEPKLEAEDRPGEGARDDRPTLAAWVAFKCGRCAAAR
jgi:hypothetical protein